MVLIKSFTLMVLLNIVTSYPHANCRVRFNQISSIRKSFAYVPRGDWKALPSKDMLISSNKAVPLIMVNHTNTPYCHRKLACARSVKKLQHQSMAGGFIDIQYNFLIDPHGNVFEGLGWCDLQTDYVDQKYRTIGFIGMENTELTRHQKEAITDLFEEALQYNFLSNDFRLCSTPDMVGAMTTIKIDLDMDIDNDDSQDITKAELHNLKRQLSMENIDCVMKTKET